MRVVLFHYQRPDTVRVAVIWDDNVDEVIFINSWMMEHWHMGTPHLVDVLRFGEDEPAPLPLPGVYRYLVFPRSDVKEGWPVVKR